MVTTIKNQFGHEDTGAALSKSENLMHNKRQQQLASFYKTVSDSIEPFNTVILVGPTNAKSELLTILNADLRFEESTIEIQAPDEITDNQKKAFMKSYILSKE